MDLHILSQVVDELAAVLPGARVEKAVQTSGTTLTLVLHQPRRDRFLLLSADRALPRMHLVRSKPAGAAASAGFFLLLKKHLARSRLQDIGLVNNDRVVELRFAGTSGPVRLIGELTGASANIILAGSDDAIIAVMHPVPPGDRTARPLVPGLVYEPPLLRATAPRGARPDIDQPEPDGDLADTPVNRAVEAWYERLTAELEHAALRRTLAAAVRSALLRTERRRAAVSRDAAAAEHAHAYRAAGELILSRMHELHKGQDRAVLRGYDGEPVDIVLDPSRSPAENAERYFRKYKKARDGIAVMRERLAEAEAGIRFLREQSEAIEAACDLHALEAVRTILTRQGFLRAAGGKAGGAKPAAAPPYRTVTFEGWDILVGKSAAGNDYITLKLARPDDLWLHAEGMPGSHVVVRNPQKRDIPASILKRAASLAAYHSKGRGAAKVPVTYSRAALVKKPKGAAPGMVTVSGRKTVMAAPEPEERTQRRPIVP